MDIDLIELAGTVTDEPTFLNFLNVLAADWHAAEAAESANPSAPYGPSALGWENWTFGAVVGAAARWGEASTNGLQFYEKPTNPWQRAAEILAMGKYYE